MGIGEAWGSEQELQHPRDTHGRFRASWKMAESVITKILAALASFNPRTFNNDQEAQTYVHGRARGNRFLTNRGPEIERFLRGYSKANEDLRAGKPNKDAEAIKKGFSPLPDDLILSRIVSPQAFGVGDISQMEELTGKLIHDKGFSSTNIGTPMSHQPGNITMSIVTPKGTNGLIPNTSRPSKEIILDTQQPYRVTKVKPDGQGGFNIFAVAVGHSEGETSVDISKSLPEKNVSAGAPQTPETPQAPAAPGAPAPAVSQPAPVPTPAAPVRTGKPGRPAGPPPAPRNDGHVADSVGTGQAPAAPSSAQANAPGSAPSTPAAPEVPVTPETGPDARNTFRDAFDKANIKVPTVGTRRKQYMDTYNGVASGKKTPSEAVSELDNHITANKKILASDKADGTDSGPLPEDIKRQQALRDLIAEHFNLTGRKKFKESSGETKSPATKKTAPAPVAPKKATPEKAPPAVVKPAPESPTVTKTTVSDLREQAKKAGVQIPKGTRKLDDIHAALIKGLAEKKAAPSVPSKQAVPAPARPQIPAKDLSDKGLLQRFEAEIKKENPDGRRLKELGDELDRRDLQTADRIKGLNDTDLEKQFTDAIRADNIDQTLVDRLGAEMDRRDAQRAAQEVKVDALVAKGRDFRDAWAEVHGKDPTKLDQEERQSLLDANRRPGETRDQSLRRQYAEATHQQYLAAEKETRGHLLTPEGRAKGVDPKSLFTGSNVNANKYASDELKDFWKKNPRKTLVQYKADTLGGKENIAAAKKTEGIARTLDLGERLTRKSPQKKAIPVPEQVSLDYKKTTIAQLRQQAADRGIEVPKKLRLKQDIFDHVVKEMASKEQARRGGAPSAPTAKVPQAPKATTPEVTKASVPADNIDKMTIPQLRAEAKRQKKRVPSGVTRKADIVDFLKGGGAPEKQAAPKAPNLPGSPKRYQDVGIKLKSAQSREEAHQILADEKMTVPQLKELADSLNIAVRGTKADIVRDLVHWTTGRRLDSAAVSKPGETTSRALSHAAGFKPSGGMAVSTKSVLPNHWGTIGGPVNFHDDGHIGIALKSMGNNNQLLEVPGENDNLANVLGKLATRGTQTGRGGITQQELIDEVKKIRDKFSSVPQVRQSLDKAIKDMEAPDVPIPKLPEGTPPRINQLMKELHDIPLARQPRRGFGPDSTELARLAEIMDRWSKGKLTPLSLLQEIGRIRQNRHESEEGMFNIDDVVKNALNDLEKILKTDRKSLYPPITRA